MPGMPGRSRTTRGGSDFISAPGQSQPAANGKSSNKKPKKESVTCPICEDDIIDGKHGEEAIECDGICASWLHRRCAGLSRAAFTMASKSSDPFFCPHCRLHRQELEIVVSLRDLVTSISSHLTMVNDEVSSLKKSLNELKSSNTVSASFAQAVQTSANPSKLISPPPAVVADRSASVRSDVNRKMNVVVFGLPESQKGSR